MKNETPEVEASSAPETGRPSPALPARLALWVVLAIVVVHSGIVALWVAPNNLLRQSIGASRVEDYILPMWDQAWSVFAPEADSGYDRYEIRALVKRSGGERATEWTQVTAHEVVASVRHHPFPSRTALITTRLGGHLKRYYNVLNTDQKQIVADADREVSLADLRARLLAASDSGVERDRVGPFLRAETATEHFLSGIAHAIWGDDVVALQFRKDKVVVSRYTDADKPRQVRTAYQHFSNWRPPIPLTVDERAAFAAYVDEFGIGAT